ncbi:MAG: hypothetical protein ACTH31_14830, partial [Pseudoclavibacter sp.]
RNLGLEPLDTARVVADLCATPATDLAERALDAGTSVQLWPHRHGTDAMFLALLRKPLAGGPADSRPTNEAEHE